MKTSNNTTQTDVPEMREAPMTHSRTRSLREKFNLVVEALIKLMEPEETPHKLINLEKSQEDSNGPKKDQMEDITRLNLKQVFDTENQGMYIHYAGQGVQNNKNAQEIRLDRQVAALTSQLAVGDQISSNCLLGAENMEYTEYLNHTNLRSPHAKKTIEDSMKNELVQQKIKSMLAYFA